MFFPNDEAEGPCLIEKSTWSGLGMAFPRSRLPHARKRTEFKRTGVYILWGPGDSEDLPRAYVGESDVLKPRLENHASNKDFWTHAIALVSKDQNLNKAHVRYMDWRLIDLASAAQLSELENSQNPSEPSLSEADKADAELFLADMLECLPVLGVTFFSKPSLTGTDVRRFTIQSKGVRASGYEDTNGFVVLSGSQAVTSETASFHRYLRDMRETLRKSEVLADEEGSLRFKRDHRFKSPSAAASVVLGATSNGRQIWMDAKGRSLNDLAKAESS